MRGETRKLSQPVDTLLTRCPLFVSRLLVPVVRYASDQKSHLATWGVLLALTWVAFLLRSPHLDAQSLWRGEGGVIRFANWPLPQLVQSLMQARHNGPLYFLLMRGWLRLVGDSEFGLRYLSLCFGVWTVPLAYRVGRQLVGRQAALIGAVLVVVAPYLVWYSQDAKMYTMVAALTLLAMVFQLKALATGRLWWWMGFVLVASLSLYLHILSALMIPVYVALFLLGWPGYRRGWRAGLVSFGLLTLPYVPLAIWQLPMVLDTYETGHPFYPIHDMLALLINLYSRGVAMVGGWWVVAAFVFAILGGVFSSTRTDTQSRPLDDRRIDPGGVRSRLALLLWLFLPVALVYLISLRAPVFEPRYLIFVAPAFYLLTAWGLLALSRLSWVAAGLSLGLVLSFSLLGVWVQANTPIKSDFRRAAAYVMARHQDHTPIMFQMPYVRYTFDYYFDGDYVALEGPWTNDAQARAQVDGEMARLMADHTDVWLVASESWLWDSQDLARAWLDTRAHLVDAASFALVDVYHYDLSGGSR